MIEHPERIALGTVREIGREAGVHPNALVQLARRAGFGGYRDFRGAFARHIKDGAGTMSFMIPAAVAKEGAPAPGGEQVTLGKVPGGKIAVIRFKGHRSEQKREAAVAALQEWITQKGWAADGAPFFMKASVSQTAMLSTRSSLLPKAGYSPSIS